MSITTWTICVIITWMIVQQISIYFLEKRHRNLFDSHVRLLESFGDLRIKMVESARSSEIDVDRK